jgi:hypothetical protein
MTNPTMTAYASEMFGTPTYKLMPSTTDCPFNEAIYDATRGVLAIVSKTHKEKPMMLPRIDENGNAAQKKGVKTGNPEIDTAYQRVFMQQYYEYYIEEKSDILNFLNRHVEHVPLAFTDMVSKFTPAAEPEAAE